MFDYQTGVRIQFSNSHEFPWFYPTPWFFFHWDVLRQIFSAKLDVFMDGTEAQRVYVSRALAMMVSGFRKLPY